MAKNVLAIGPASSEVNASGEAPPHGRVTTFQDAGLEKLADETASDQQQGLNQLTDLEGAPRRRGSP